MTDDHRPPDELGEHLSIDELADLDEGLLPAERTSAIRAHLHSCEQCRAGADAITTTRSTLADLPRPTVPDDVRARLDDALAAQSPAGEENEPAELPDTLPPDHTEPENTAPLEAAPTPVDVIPAPGAVARRRLGRPTLAASAVAAALVLAVGAIVVGALNHHHNQPESGGAGTALPQRGGPLIASAQPAHFFQTSTGRTYTLTNLTPDVQGLIARAPATTAAPTSAPTPSAHKAGGTAGSGSSGTSGSSSTSGSKATARSPKSPSGNAPPHSTTTSTPPIAGSPQPLAENLDQQAVPKALKPLAGSRSKILACAAVLTTARNAVPLAVDFGKWTDLSAAPPIDNAPAAIFIFKSPSQSAVAVYVTAPACRPDTIYTYRLVPSPG